MGQESAGAKPSLSKQTKVPKRRRHFPGTLVRPATAPAQAQAAAEAVVMLDRIVLAARAHKPLPQQQPEKQDLFEAWYGRYLRQQKARRESRRQEVAFGLAVCAAVTLVMIDLWGGHLLLHRYATGWELMPILFGSLVGFSLLFYKLLGRRR